MIDRKWRLKSISCDEFKRNDRSHWRKRIMRRIKVLAGHDVRREPGYLHVEVRDGEVFDAKWGHKLEVTGTTTIMGWGSLDGDAYVVEPDGASWEVSVPKSTWDKMTASTIGD